jgi:lipoprotein NlpD
VWVQNTTRLLSVAAALLLLVGCSASWKAPLESRTSGTRYAGHPASEPIRSHFYKVKRGDTLYAIAWRANRDYRSLARWNNIKPPYVIYPGQVLRLVPKGKSGSSPVAKAPRAEKPRRNTAVTKKRQIERATTRSTAAGKVLRWNWPADGPLLSTFSANDVSRKGIKIGGRPGQPVRASEAGRVVYSGSGLVGYGRLIIIKHNDSYLSAYGHNEKLLVKEGDRVTKGKQIAAMGRSNDGKPMLHFEIRREGKPINPLKLLPARK